MELYTCVCTCVPEGQPSRATQPSAPSTPQQQGGQQGCPAFALWGCWSGGSAPCTGNLRAARCRVLLRAPSQGQARAGWADSGARAVARASRPGAQRPPEQPSRGCGRGRGRHARHAGMGTAEGRVKSGPRVRSPQLLWSSGGVAMVSTETVHGLRRTPAQQPASGVNKACAVVGRVLNTSLCQEQLQESSSGHHLLLSPAVPHRSAAPGRLWDPELHRVGGLSLFLEHPLCSSCGRLLLLQVLAYPSPPQRGLSWPPCGSLSHLSHLFTRCPTPERVTICRCLVFCVSCLPLRDTRPFSI